MIKAPILACVVLALSAHSGCEDEVKYRWEPGDYVKITLTGERAMVTNRGTRYGRQIYWCRVEQGTVRRGGALGDGKVPVRQHLAEMQFGDFELDEWEE